MNFVKKTGKFIFTVITKISPRANARILFFMRTKKIPNLKCPKTFNEKTTYLKLYPYANNQTITNLADKYLVRSYVEKCGCANILNELYGVYDTFEQIDISKFPNKFVLKCNHGCAYNIIVSDKQKYNKEEIKRKIDKWMKEKYGFATCELHYTNIKPKIICEKYLCNDNGKMPVDYKFYCFNGEPKCVLVCSEREKKLKLNYYDLNWKELNYTTKKWHGNKYIKKPDNFDKMIKYARKLSNKFPFVRVDLYNNNGKIVFGELTFTPACCCAPYYSTYGNEKLGKQLTIKEII